MKRDINLKIDSRIENIPLLSSAIKGICNFLEFDKKDTYMFELCIFEAVTNCIKHAYNQKPGFYVDIVFSILDSSIEIIVKDYGQPMDTYYLSKEHLQRAKNSVIEDGRGLLIITEYMDSVDYTTKDGTNILYMKKSIKNKE